MVSDSLLQVPIWGTIDHYLFGLHMTGPDGDKPLAYSSIIWDAGSESRLGASWTSDLRLRRMTRYDILPELLFIATEASSIDVMHRFYPKHPLYL